MAEQRRDPRWWRGLKLFGSFVVGLFTILGAIFAGLSLHYPDTSLADRLSALQKLVSGNPNGAMQSVAPASVQPSSSAPVPPPPVALQQSETNGIVASVTAATVKQNQLNVSLMVKNNTPYRLYFTDARADPTQTPTIDGGKPLYSPNVSLMTFCNSEAPNCLSNPSEMMLSKFTYVDAGKEVPVGLNYNIGDADAAATSHVTFSMTLIGRLTRINPNQSNLPQAQVFRFNFNSVPVNKL